MARKYQISVIAKGDVDDAVKGLGKLEKRAGKFSGNVRKVATRAAAGLGVLAVATGAAAIKMTNMASDAVETRNKLTTVLGSGVKRVTKQLDAFAVATGSSRYALREQAATISALLKPMGMSSKAMESMTVNTVKLAKDLSSFHNIAEGDALEKLRAGLTGEAEPLKALGILMNESTVKAYAYKHGIAAIGSTLTEQQKVQARYGVIMEQTKDAQGDATRTANGYANLQKSVRNAVIDTATSVGMKLLPTFTTMAARLNKFIRSDKFQAWVATVGDKLAQLAQRFGRFVASEKFAKQMKSVGTSLVTVAGALLKVGMFLLEHNRAVLVVVGALATFDVGVKAIRVGLIAYGAATKAVAIASRAFTIAVNLSKLAMYALNVAMRANPIGLIITGLTLAAAGFVLAYKRSETFRAVCQTVFRAVGTAIKSVVPVLKAIGSVYLKALTTYFTVWRTVVVGVMRGIVAAVKLVWAPLKAIGSVYIAGVRVYFNLLRAAGVAAWNGIRTAWSAAATFFGGIRKSLASKFSGMWDGIKNAFRSAINGIIGMWNNLTFTIPPVKVAGKTVMPGVSISTPNLPYLATGGNIAGSGAAIVGEAGPELLQLPRGARVTPLTDGQKSVGGDVYHISVRDEIDLDALVQRLQRRSRRLGA